MPNIKSAIFKSYWLNPFHIKLFFIEFYFSIHFQVYSNQYFFSIDPFNFSIKLDYQNEFILMCFANSINNFFNFLSLCFSNLSL